VEAIEKGGFGRVEIDGDVWKAVTQDDEAVPVGTNVRVIDRESIIITVEVIP
jgi:membrane protein implicated in regulation of membrane protease activity